MAASGLDIVWALITEIIAIWLAIALKADKRKVVAALIIGTLLAGIIGIGMPFYLHSKENVPSLSNSRGDPPSLPDGSFPNSDLTGSISQTQIVKKLNTIHTSKARGTIKGTNTDGKTFLYQNEVEYITPDKRHSILFYEGKEIDETITVDDQYCRRDGQQDDWFCGGRGPIPNGIQRWAEIVRGEANNPRTTVIDHGIRVYTWHAKKCYLYYKIEVDNNTEAKSISALCIDPDTLLPVEYFYSDQYDVMEYDIFDINEPLDISLPVQ